MQEALNDISNGVLDKVVVSRTKLLAQTAPPEVVF